MHDNLSDIQSRKDDEEEKVYDSSKNYKGRIPLRASTGSWRASFFIIAIEFSERMSFFGIATNMITYMTKVMHQDLETAANTVNIWMGVSTVTPLLGGFLADAYTSRFPMILISAVLYVLGLGLFTMSQYVPSFKPCGKGVKQCQETSKSHMIVFFMAAFIVALATGGYRPCLESFGADQFDDNHAKEREQKMSYFNWWNVSLCCGLFLGVTLIVYIEDYVSWGVGFLILTITMSVTIVVFVIGTPYYRYRMTPQGSPLIPMLQVLVAALAKRNSVLPSDPSLLNEISNSSEKLQGPRLNHTDRLRFFDKAAIIEQNEIEGKKQSSWRLATVTQVEELKLLINMIPIWFTSLIFGVVISQGSTFFIKQGSAMNRRIFKHFEIPPASMASLTALGMIVTVAIYDQILIPFLRRATRNERGVSLLSRIGIGMVIVTISMIVSALVERERLSALQDNEILSVLWLTPQFLLIGIADGFSLVGMQEYFYDQVPDSMRSLGMAFYLSVIGFGKLLSSLLMMMVNRVTGMNGGKRWIGKDLNHSRLDYFYWLLAVIFGVNMCVFVVVAKNHRYKNVRSSESDFCKGDKGVEMVGI